MALSSLGCAKALACFHASLLHPQRTGTANLPSLCCLLSSNPLYLACFLENIVAQIQSPRFVSWVDNPWIIYRQQNRDQFVGTLLPNHNPKTQESKKSTLISLPVAFPENPSLTKKKKRRRRKSPRSYQVFHQFSIPLFASNGEFGIQGAQPSVDLSVAILIVSWDFNAALASACSRLLFIKMCASPAAPAESKKTVWVWTENRQVMTAAVERGWSTFLFGSKDLGKDWSCESNFSFF